MAEPDLLGLPASDPNDFGYFPLALPVPKLKAQNEWKPRAFLEQSSTQTSTWIKGVCKQPPHFTPAWAAVSHHEQLGPLLGLAGVYSDGAVPELLVKLHECHPCLYPYHSLNSQVFNSWRFLITTPHLEPLALFTWTVVWRLVILPMASIAFHKYPASALPSILKHWFLYCVICPHLWSHLHGLNQLHPIVSKKFGAWYDGSTDKDTCPQAWWPEFYPWNQCSRRRNLTPSWSPLMSTAHPGMNAHRNKWCRVKKCWKFLA